MRFSKIIPSALLLLVSLLSSCMTYTYQDALQEIPAERSLPSDELPSTRKVVPEEPKMEETPPVVTEKAITSIETALVPLPCGGPKELLDLIIQEVHDRSFDIAGFTGDTESLNYVASQLSTPVYWTEQGLFVTTKLPVSQSSSQFIQVTTDTTRAFNIALVDMQESTVFEQLLEEPLREDWQGIVLEANRARRDQVAYLLDYQEEEPLLVLASLAEPAGADWFETADGHSYRTKLAWPLVEEFQERRFLDSWSMTHYHAATKSGHTWTLVTEKEVYAERVDFLLSLKLIPVRTMTIPMGPWETHRLPYEYRSAVTGTFILP